MIRLTHVIPAALIACRAFAAAQNCEPAKLTFKTLNEQVIVGSDEPEKARTYPALVREVTQKLHALVDEQIIAQLDADRFLQPANVVLRISCVQSLIPAYARGQGGTNTPIAHTITNVGMPAVAVGYLLLRGGIGAVDTQPYLEVFRKNGDHWGNAGSVGSDFEWHTFFVQPFGRLGEGQTDFLLWGSQIGMGNAPLRMALAVYNGKSLAETWSTNIPGGAMKEISVDKVTIFIERTNENGRAEDSEEVYQPVPGGMELVSRRVLKVY